MSVDTFVFLEDGKLPTITEWNAALKAANLDLVLDSVENLRDFSGFLPAKLNGRDAGFEWFFGSVKDVFGADPGDIGARTAAADFCTHSDMTELASALLAAAVLAKLVDGLPFDGSSGEFSSADDLIQVANEVLREL